MEHPASRNYFWQFSCFSNKKKHKPQLGSYDKCLENTTNAFSLFLDQVYVSHNCTLWLGRGCWSLELLSKSIQGQEAKCDRVVTVCGDKHFSKSGPTKTQTQETHTQTVQTVYLRFFRTYFSVSVTCISDSFGDKSAFVKLLAQSSAKPRLRRLSWDIDVGPEKVFP